MDQNKAEISSISCSCIDCPNEATRFVSVVHQYESGAYCESCAIHLSGHAQIQEKEPDLKNSKPTKAYFCQYDCDTQIKFDNSKVSVSGKRIPLELNGTPHRCANNPYNQSTTTAEKKVYSCNYCGKEITFDDNKKTASGRSIPLNSDKTNHDCPKHPNKLVEQGGSQKPSEQSYEHFDERTVKDYRSHRTDDG
jgi:hypothetical protein